MRMYFMFKPCKSDGSFKLIPKVKLDRKTMVKRICEKLNGEVLADTDFLSIVRIGEAQISVSNKCEIIIREIKSETEAQNLARDIMRVLE